MSGVELGVRVNEICIDPEGGALYISGFAYRRHGCNYPVLESAVSSGGGTIEKNPLRINRVHTFCFYGNSDNGI